MRSVRAVYEDGQVVFSQESLPTERSDVIVTFLDHGDGGRQPAANAGQQFVEKWSGVIEGTDIADWKDRKAEHMKRKPE